MPAVRTSTNPIPHARWSVMWVSKGEIYEREYEVDLSEAVRVYVLLIRAGKKGATLRCQNVGFPPPKKFRGRMEALNRRGIWWCPYCMKMRKFENRAGFEIEDVWVSYGDRVKVPCCPMCDISSRDGNVMRYNPMAANLANRRKSRGGKKRGGRQRKRS